MSRRDGAGEDDATLGVDAESAAAGHNTWSAGDEFDDLPPLTPAERRAIRRQIARTARLRRTLESRDRAALAELLREEELPLWARRAIADIIDPRVRWQPPWLAYSAMEEALIADDPEETLRTSGYPQQIITSVLGELRALRFAHAYEGLRGERLTHREAIGRLAERHEVGDRTIEKLVARGRASVLFDPTP
jgi:hypothetical protein